MTEREREKERERAVRNRVENKTYPPPRGYVINNQLLSSDKSIVSIFIFNIDLTIIVIIINIIIIIIIVPIIHARLGLYGRPRFCVVYF